MEHITCAESLHRFGDLPRGAANANVAVRCSNRSRTHLWLHKLKKLARNHLDNSWPHNLGLVNQNQKGGHLLMFLSDQLPYHIQGVRPNLLTACRLACKMTIEAWKRDIQAIDVSQSPSHARDPKHDDLTRYSHFVSTCLLVDSRCATD